MNLKYRIWDYDNNAFDYIDLQNIEKTIETLDSIRDYFHADYLLDNPKFIQKAAGVNDKKGQEIYLGDRFQSINNSVGNLLKTPVLYYEDQRWILKSENKNYEYLDYYETETDLHIIGNIHENP